jgi:hypothetical protein
MRKMNNSVVQIDKYTYCVLEQIRKEFVLKKSQEKEKKEIRVMR